MRKVDPALVAEGVGVVLVTLGVAFFSFPLALIALGGFLIWATESDR